MKAHLVLATIVALLFGIAPSCVPAEAATTVKSSKSNTSDRVIADASDEAKCAADGGAVIVRDGKKMCALPASAQ